MKVLVPLDGSRLSDAALPHVRRLLARAATRCEVHLLHVASEATDAPLEARAEARSHLAACERLLAGEGFRVRTRVVAGDPVQEILEHVVEERIELVAMATHGRTGVKRWIRGSVAERVLRACPVPLLLVNPHGVLLENDDVHYRRLLVPLLPGAPTPTAAVPTIAALAGASGAEVVLLRAGSADASGDCSRTLVRLLAERGVTAVTTVDVDEPARAVLDTAEAVAPDLIALCAGPRTRLSAWPLEAVVDRVTRKAPCPVLVLRGAVPALHGA